MTTVAERTTGARPATERPLVVTASPHLKGRDSVPTIMWNVVGALAPLVAAAAWFFGVGALLVVLASVAGAVLTEHFLGNRSARSASGGRRGTLADGSAAITGILLGLTLPAGMPLWMPFIGGVFAIGVGKLVFGGLGYNIFNPALLGRAFLQAAFPVAITTWPKVGGDFWTLRGDLFAFPFASARAPDAITAATPLGLFKFERQLTDAGSLLVGTVGGSLGETSALLILLCGGYLALRRYLDWRIPASILASVAAFQGILHAVAPERYATPTFMLFSGGLMLGAVFMATDMVTAPLTKAGRWLFGLGIGVLVVVIRVWGGLPEGVMYAILLMNAFVPFINKATQPRVFGTSRQRVVVRGGAA
ncbi:MAG TPA: RnfABCDGE type electron transport complex subunit D [Gemmatimonadaceae bacterium]|nr:RnfABCDGE type electron transport complex subunit D [Gemmatimonadaceae bacterium]